MEILGKARGRGASDVHVVPGYPVMFRTDGIMEQAAGERLTSADTEALVRAVLAEARGQAACSAECVPGEACAPGSEGAQTQKESGPVCAENDVKTCAHTADGADDALIPAERELVFTAGDAGRVRAGIFRQRGGWAATFHLLFPQIPEPKELGVPEAFIGLAVRKKGLVLVAGPSGSGATTTLAAMIHVIAEHFVRPVITLEALPEYLHKGGLAPVSQREIGADCESYASGLRAALHQDPDVILVGELCDAETVSLALTAAETGHLVFAQLPADSVTGAVSRMAGVFLPVMQLDFFRRLSGVLEGIAVQQLIPRQNEKGRVAAFEILLASRSVRSLLRDGKIGQLPSAIKEGEKEGMQLMDDALRDLYMKSVISRETAVAFAQDTADMRRRLELF